MKQSNKQHKHRVIISGGGTGGHIFPAIAIANTLKDKVPDIEILFIGAKGKMEMEKVPKAGYPIEGLWISGLQRKLTLKNLSFPFKVISSLIKANKIISRFCPAIVVGVGGFASGPTLRIAAGKGIPTVIQEQNSYPGITNKLLAKKVDRICVAYEGMDKFFPKEKILLTGNPIRTEMCNLTGKKESGINYFGLSSEKTIVLIIGGSQGALSINKCIRNNIDRFMEKDIQLIWQTGKYFFETALAKTKDPQLRGIKVTAFIERMDYAYASADIIVSRAGAIAISEICATGKPTIFVPLPTAAEDHQTKNAKTLVNKKAALMVSDSEVNEKLIDMVVSLAENKVLQGELSGNILKLARTDAAEKIADEILNLGNLTKMNRN